MKVGLNGTGVLALAGVVGAGVLLYLAYRNGGAIVKKAGEVLSTDLNPASTENVVYRGVNAVGEAATGEKDFSLGVWLWEVMNPDKVRAERDMFLPQASYDETERLKKRYPAYTGGASGSW